jgi:hypothetical protein
MNSEWLNVDKWLIGITLALILSSISLVLQGCVPEVYQVGIDETICECKSEPLAIIDLDDGGYDCVCGDR